VRILAPDLPEARIAQELQRLRGAGVLRGSRGAEPADIASVARAAARLGELVRARPEVEELDINPLVVYPQGVLALDALVVVS